MASILIVDDERNIRTHLATFVRRLGHTAETAADAAAALAALERQPVDLVFSDVRMAGMDGLALLRDLPPAAGGGRRADDRLRDGGAGGRGDAGGPTTTS
jgi:CheY-like chemotaxis protein